MQHSHVFSDIVHCLQHKTLKYPKTADTLAKFTSHDNELTTNNNLF